VGVHHDAKLEPYYTIRLRDGKEKQVDGKNLTPIQELDTSIKKGSSHGESGGESRGRHSSIKQKVHSVDVSMTDQMSDSSSDCGSATGSSSSSSVNASFNTGQNAYYRSSDGHISKVKVIKVYPSSSKYKYGVDLPDGTSKDVVADQLKALIDLTSDELAILMKQKNEKPRPKEVLALPSTDDLDPGDEAKNSDSSHETEQETCDSKQLQQPEEERPVLPCSVEMVEAKTEDGGTKIVPMYAAEMELYYKNAEGLQKATILSVHLDDLLDPYYSIRLEDGREKQTDNAHLILTLEGCDAERKTEETQQESKEHTEKAVEGSRDGDCAVSDTGLENLHNTSAKESNTYSEEELALVPVDLVERSETSGSGYSGVGQDNTPQAKKQVEPPAHALALVHNFATGDEALYSSSQGEHLRATVLKLLKDKKHRPYYVVRLPDGKEKQVYDHRLSPLLIGRAESPVDPPNRCGRSRSTTRRRARSEAPTRRTHSRGSESSDLQKRRGSFSSDEKKKSVRRSNSLLRRSASREHRSQSREPRSQSRGPIKSRSRANEDSSDSRLHMKSLRKSIR